jgi:myo-inositol-1(or 4)-monophosphatase
VRFVVRFVVLPNWRQIRKLAEMKDTLLECVRQAGALLLQHFGKNIGVNRKGSASDIVTAADLASERLITDLIHARHPAHNLLGEEGGLQHRGSDITWVIDPLDGTSNFAAGLPWFGVMVAVLRQAKPILAAMYLPATDVLYTAELGSGTLRNGKPLQIISECELSNTLCAYGLDACDHSATLEKQLHLMGLLVQKARNIRLTNSLQDFAYTLDGQFGACVNQHCMIWDIAPACLLFPEAGGTFTDLQGRDIRLELDPEKYLRSYAVVGANPALHGQVVKLARAAGF